MTVFMAALRCLGAFVVVFIAALFFVAGPRLDRHDEQKAALERLENDYVFKKWQALNLDDLRVRKREAEALLDRLSAMLPTTFDGDVEHVAEAARRHHVRIESSPPGREGLREFYSTRSMRINASGRFHDLGAFAAELGGAPGCLRLQDINLHRSSTTGQVTMQAVVWAYRYMEKP
jgi:type IV pilus assembly protein PilO